MRLGFLTCIAAVAAVCSSSAAGAVPATAVYEVTVTAAQRSTWTCPASEENRGTLTAAIVSLRPVRATLRNGRLRFASYVVPLRVTVTIAQRLCGESEAPAPACGTTTATMQPGGSLEAEPNRIRFGYDNNTRLFPESDSCSSGLLELGGDAVFDAGSLLLKQRTVVAGAVSTDEVYGTDTTAGPERYRTEMSFKLVFVRIR